MKIYDFPIIYLFSISLPDYVAFCRMILAPVFNMCLRKYFIVIVIIIFIITFVVAINIFVVDIIFILFVVIVILPLPPLLALMPPLSMPLSQHNFRQIHLWRV